MRKIDEGVSASLEDYLEAIYFLNGKNEGVRVTDIASELNISKPSVNRAINTLKSQGLVDHEHYGCLTLTNDGLSIAQSVAERHMKLKKFLCDVLGVEDSIAENEACLIEHHLSSDTVEKISDYTEEVLREDKSER